MRLLLFVRDEFNGKEPALIVRPIFERFLFSDPRALDIFGIDPIDSSLVEPAFERASGIRVALDIFNTPLHQYSIMFRETVIRGMKTLGRRRRTLDFYYKDLSTLIDSCHWADKEVAKHGVTNPRAFPLMKFAL
jgi:hypothetical protein